MPNPVLNRVQPDQMPDDIKSMWKASMDLRGDAAFMEVGANHAELFRWYIDSFYGQVFNGGKVPNELKQLLRLRLSNIHGCKFCNQGNRQDALAAGVAPEKVDALFDYENGPFSDAEKAALRLADQMVLTNPDGHLTPELHADLRPHFDDAQIYEMGMVMGILAGIAKFIFVYDLVEREPSCPFPAHQAAE